jgi:hypothetical protein
VELPEVEGVTITADPENATQGDVHVTAVAQPGYTISGDSEWQVSIGNYYLCQAQVIKPIAVPITQCGMYGDIYYFESEGLTYVETPADAQEGVVDVTYTVAEGYEAVGSDLGPWQFNLGTYEMCEPEVVTHTETITEPVLVEVPVTQTLTVTEPVLIEVPVTQTLTVTEPVLVEVPVTQTLTVTEPVQVEVPVTQTVTVTEPVTVEIPVTVTLPGKTIYQIEPITPGFVDATCENQQTNVLLPTSEVVQYDIGGNILPGSTVTITARLKEGHPNTELIGITVWSHAFPTIESLNCEVNQERLYFPQVEN